MTAKLTVRCIAWRPLHKNTLRGFADICIVEMRMTIREVAVHAQGPKAWAQPPARPWIQGGELVREAGKIQYSPILEFDGAAVRAAFSAAVVRAVRDYDPRALDVEAAA